MSLLTFNQVQGYRATMTLYEVFETYVLEVGDATRLMHCQIQPTEKMLKAISKEYEVSVENLKEALNT
jgi:hypothetical protein